MNLFEQMKEEIKQMSYGNCYDARVVRLMAIFDILDKYEALFKQECECRQLLRQIYDGISFADLSVDLYDKLEKMFEEANK